MAGVDYSNPAHFNAYTGANNAAESSSSRSRPAPTNNKDDDNNGKVVDNAVHALLTQRLSQFTRGSDRRQVLRSLGDPKLMPRMHTLKSVWVADIAAAEREAAGERASLNGVKFLQVKNLAQDETDHKKPVDSYFLQTLREICGHMCDMDGVDADPMALYGGLLLRLSRTVSERDALETVTLWACGKGELVVLPLKKRHHDRTCRLPQPVEVELYVESGNVHAKVSMRHEMGLYRRTDLESQGLSKELIPWSALIAARDSASMRSSSSRKMNQIQYEALGSAKFTSPKPWVFMDADVVERINFGTGSSVRILHVRLPEDRNSGYTKKW